MIYTETYRIRNYETDGQGLLTPLALVNYLQDVADRHAVLLGVGMPTLAESGLSWVLHRLTIQVVRWPSIGEEVVLETHPSGLERIYVFRDFRMYDPFGNLLITATSTWLVFNTASRSLTAPAAHFKTVFDPFRHLSFLPRSTRKFPSLLPATPRCSLPVRARHNEIDTNEHVNNSVYVQWLMEALPASLLATHQCQELDIQYKKECTREDIILSISQPLPNAERLHVLVNQEGKEVAIGLSRWLVRE